MGNGNYKFDKHVYNCRHKHKNRDEPYFIVYTFMTVAKESMLLPMEKHLHEMKLDTMN